MTREIGIRFTENDYNELRTKSTQMGLSISAYVRFLMSQGGFHYEVSSQ